jgi:dimethylamine monooxygenase subunit A
VSLGFSVEALLPAARVSGPLRMGLVRLAESEWLQLEPDLAARNAAFDAHPDSIVVHAQAESAARELVAMIGVRGGLEQAARSVWEDLCILTSDGPGEPYRLTAAAVAFPTDWRLAEKMGRALVEVHAPIHGYAGQLSAGVDRFMAGLEAGAVFGRSNAFVVASDALRYLPTDDPAPRFAHVTAKNAGETLFVRCERQTLRRLPRSGAIVFTIGIYRAALVTLSDAALIRLARSLEGFGEGESDRRAAPFYSEALSGYAASRRVRAAA